MSDGRVVPPGVGPAPEAETARIAPVVAGILRGLGRSLTPGMRTRDVADAATGRLREAGLGPQMLHYQGFPAPIAVSIDDEVLHGIPSERRLEAGQLVKIQIGASTTRGFAAQGWTFAVGGRTTDEKARLHDCGIRALEAALGALRDHRRTGDPGAAIQETFEADGFRPVRDYVGYRIDAQPMREPQLPCYGRRGQGLQLRSGMVLHVHAIGVAGGFEVVTGDDRWTVTTRDGKPSVLFTAVARVTAAGHDLLTPLGPRLDGPA